MEEFHSIFEAQNELPPKRLQDHAICLQSSAKVPNIRPYRYPYYQKNEIEKIVKEMLSASTIKPSTNPFSSPVLLVKKKDGSWLFSWTTERLTASLYRISVPNKFPISVIDELLDELGGARIFTKLDLKSGYNQIRVREEDTEKTTFRTHEVNYEFLVMPFGLNNTPSTFQ